MDKAQLITIAISALAGAIAKPLIEWLISIIKNTEIVKGITAIAKIAFSKTNRAVIFDILNLSIYVAILVNFALDKTPPTKLDILIAIGASLACLVFSISLFVHIIKALNANKN